MNIRAGIVYITGVALLAGCSTVSTGNAKKISKAATQSSNTNLSGQGLGLPPQTLADGSCGVFLWDDARPQRYVFFHDLDNNVVKYFYQDAVISLQVDPLSPPSLDARDLLARYQADGFKKIRVTGQFSGKMDGGQRISAGAITLEKLDGWVEIKPATGLYFCQPDAS